MPIHITHSALLPTLFVASICLFGFVTGASAQAPNPADAEKLTAILGSAPDKWDFSRRGGTQHDYQLPTIDGQPVLSAGPNATILVSKTAITSDTEVTVRFRYALGAERDIWFWVSPGIKKPEDNGENIYKLHLGVPKGLEQETVNWSLPAISPLFPSAYGSSSIRSLPASRLTWPELARARVEHDFASVAGLSQRWLTVRYVLRKNAFQIWFDDRLLRDARGLEIDPFGALRLTLFDGVQLGSLRIRPLPPDDPRFEKVRLDNYVNATKIKGATLQRDALPQGGQDLKVQGVPFLLPTPNEQGHEHIDLKASWLRGGLVEGPHDGWEGDTARWRGALYRDPGRIQFRVRNARYRALHLLAAFEGEPDTTPVVTAQFYRANAGHPINYVAAAPAFATPGKNALPVQLAGGAKGHLYKVTILLEPVTLRTIGNNLEIAIPYETKSLDAFADQDHLEFELTKEIRVHRSYPDPIYYSQHGAGLPSGVHVFAMTLERPAVDIDWQPDRFAHVWTAPDRPSYTAKLRNNTDVQQDVALELTANPLSGNDLRKFANASLPPRGEQTVTIPVHLNKYGCHQIELLIKDGESDREVLRSLAYLHPDTRERGNWEEGKGPIFGFWDWNGAHITMSGVPRLQVMGAAGAESKMSSFYTEPLKDGDLYPDADKKYARDHKWVTFFHAYQLSMGKHILGVDWDPSKPAEMQKALIAGLKKQPQLQRSEINKPELALFFAEPVLGPISYMSQPEHYGEPPYQMTADEQKNYENHLAQFVTAARAIKQEWPGTKCLLPWGLPLFPLPFLRHSKEATELMDGPALDVVLFERLPEMQLHQVTLSSQMWQLKQEWQKTGKPWPNFTAVEGPAISPAAPGALTEQQEADHSIRAFLILAAYGTTRHLGWPTPSACAGSWGETHYGGGMCDRFPLYSPKPVFSAYATLTRHLNRMNFVKQVPTGSHSTFCLQFKHYKSGELLHVFWTIRGQRPVRLAMPGGKVTVYDSMDNASIAADKEGTAEFLVTPSPCYVQGLTADPKIALGEPDHPDSVPNFEYARVAELGDGTWKLSAERDADYENSHLEFVRRFPGKMSIAPATALLKATTNRGQALAVHLEKPEKERRTMPFYATLLPFQPIALPGKPSHLGLWVRAASDWGRVVYCLRDARGEKWLSVGKKGEWNVDDVHCWSQFCFDGWRYLRFELPGNAPYDAYREAGTSFWGPYGAGDAIIDLPLTLEKIIVERRTHVIAGTELQPASPDDVLLGGLHVEYETPADKTDEAIRLSRLRMPLPAAEPNLANPIRQLMETGSGLSAKVTKVVQPDREPDGTRCLVYFDPVPEAKSYDLWVSPYSDGRGAIRLAQGWTEPGKLLTGLRANTDFHVFVVSLDKDGKASKPSAPFKIHLKDMFPMK